jgi:hypothetical protein
MGHKGPTFQKDVHQIKQTKDDLDDDEVLVDWSVELDEDSIRNVIGFLQGRDFQIQSEGGRVDDAKEHIQDDVPHPDEFPKAFYFLKMDVLLLGHPLLQLLIMHDNFPLPRPKTYTQWSASCVRVLSANWSFYLHGLQFPYYSSPKARRFYNEYCIQ